MIFGPLICFKQFKGGKQWVNCGCGVNQPSRQAETAISRHRGKYSFIFFLLFWEEGRTEKSVNREKLLHHTEETRSQATSLNIHILWRQSKQWRLALWRKPFSFVTRLLSVAVSCHLFLSRAACLCFSGPL